MKFHIFRLVLACCLVLAVLAAAGADDTVIINDYGGGSFVYGGRSYIPLRSATDFLGAGLMWDSLKNQATITFDGKDIALTTGSNVAYYGGQRVDLAAPPVIVNNRTFVPVSMIRDQFGRPVIWDAEASEVRISGPNGWGRLIVNRHPGPHVVRVMKRHGQPPWAGGPGRRAAPPPGLQKKPGGLPPGQAKKLGDNNHGTVIIINDDEDDKNDNRGRGRGNDRDKDDD